MTTALTTDKTRDPQFKISAARTNIILRDPFFATILMDMNPLIDGVLTETCITDGQRVVFNPDWLIKTEPKFIAAAMRKMSLHVALSHHLRRGPRRTPAKWQAACDQAALHIMAKEKMTLPGGAIPNPMFHDMTADEIYKNLEDDDCDQPGDGEGEGDGGADVAGGGADDEGEGGGAGTPGGAQPPVGQAVDGAKMHDKADVSQKQGENDRRIVRASMAEKSVGNQSDLSKELVEQIKGHGIDWRDQLLAFIDDTAQTRFSWSKPNRRFVGEDIYLPGKVKDGIDTLAFVVDTSKSMSNRELQIVLGQIEAARDAIGIGKVVMIECDAKVGRVDEFDMTEPLPQKITFSHRGGTSMQPAFDLIAAKYDVSAILCMTDGMFAKPMNVDPGVPVLWCISHLGEERQDKVATYGDRVDLPDL